MKKMAVKISALLMQLAGFFLRVLGLLTSLERHNYVFSNSSAPHADAQRHNDQFERQLLGPSLVMTES